MILGSQVDKLEKAFGCSSTHNGERFQLYSGTHTGKRFWVFQNTCWYKILGVVPVRILVQDFGCGSSTHAGKRLEMHQFMYWYMVVGNPVHMLVKGFGCSSTRTGIRFWVHQYMCL